MSSRAKQSRRLCGVERPAVRVGKQVFPPHAGFAARSHHSGRDDRLSETEPLLPSRTLFASRSKAITQDCHLERSKAGGFAESRDLLFAWEKQVSPLHAGFAALSHHSGRDDRLSKIEPLLPSRTLFCFKFGVWLRSFRRDASVADAAIPRSGQPTRT